MSEIVPTPSVSAALAKKTTTVSDVLNAALPEPAVEATPTTPLPKSPELNASAAMLMELFDQLTKLKLPHVHRQLSPTEQKEIVDALATLKPVAKALKTSEAQLKAALFNHLDEVARANGQISEDTLRTQEGWAVLKGVVEGSAKNAERTPVPGSLTLPESGLRELEEAGEITHQEYLEMTSAKRVVDEAKTLAWIRKNPARAGLLAKVATRNRVTASLNLRDKK
jgi:hypothetical protein